METLKRVLVEGHLDTLTSVDNLAYTWKSQGRDSDALDAVRQVAKQRREILGSDHPRTRGTLADEYQRQKSLKTDLAIDM